MKWKVRSIFLKHNFSQSMNKNILLLFFWLSVSLFSQDLDDLSFGDDSSLDVATWNIEWFPKNDQSTVDYVLEIINLLDLDILAIQELDDTTMFDQMIDALPAYSGYYESNWFAGLAYIFKTGTVEINDIYEIYTTASYWNAFPRSPMVMDINFEGENYILINNHFKCCGDGVIDFNDSSDEENRRYTAMNLIKEYIDSNLSNNNVIVMGDLNDDIAEESLNNVFQNILDDSLNYRFLDLEIAQGNSDNWSFPNWPSHLDHILITNELFNFVNHLETQTIKIDEYLDGGWYEYDQNISDHRPVGTKISFNSLPFYDMNADGIVDDSDIITLIAFVINDIETHDFADINSDSVIDIYDLILLINFLQENN